MKLDRRHFIGATAAAAAIPARTFAQAGDELRPESFGARGDGVTNDTRAFAALSAEIERRRGGTIALGSGKTYVVGAQRRGHGEFGWTPNPVLAIDGLTGPLTIVGNGARLVCEPGLRFGTFELATDKPVHHALPNLDRADLASPYWAMVHIRNCRGPVVIRNLELDGNLPHLRIGGRFGDTGWQVPATGLLLEANAGAETVDNVLSHHHAQDGAMIVGDTNRSARSRFTRFVARQNGRQGLSITGGRGYDFTDCEFSHTGRSAVSSAPGAGVDIEAEGGSIIRSLSFTRCKFIDNAGAGLVADSGDSADANFSDCTFVGTTMWSAWPNKPGFRFAGCTFVGAVVHAFPDRSSARACAFIDCRFTDDPALSPTGLVYLGGGPIVNLGESDNVLFDRCRFNLVRDGTLPWSWKAIYRDCTMTQHAAQTGMTKGRYLGRTTITGTVDTYGSMVEGSLVVNGKTIPPGPQGVAPW